MIGDEAPGGHVDAPVHRGRQQNTKTHTSFSVAQNACPGAGGGGGILFCTISSDIMCSAKGEPYVLCKSIDQRKKEKDA